MSEILKKKVRSISQVLVYFHFGGAVINMIPGKLQQYGLFW